MFSLVLLLLLSNIFRTPEIDFNSPFSTTQFLDLQFQIYLVIHENADSQRALMLPKSESLSVEPKNLFLFNKKDELPWWCNSKESAYQRRRHRFYPWIRKIPWSRKRQPTPVFLLENFHTQRTLEGLQFLGLQRVGHDRAHTCM